nr:RHS repeat-associated core domain-containing protein [Saccharibacillus qingshengii]
MIYREDVSNQKAYYQHNGHSDVIGLVKADGTALNRYTYDIWGNPLTADVQVDNPFGYSGEFWDEDIGLQYLRSRWYDLSIGRFIQEDTFEGYVNCPSSLNSYIYVENNPLKYMDPTGRVAYEGLNAFLSQYAKGETNAGTPLSTKALSGAIIDLTGEGGIYLAFHQIAQVVAGKKIFEKTKSATTVEYDLNRYRVDIVSNNYMWEVKPLRWKEDFGWWDKESYLVGPVYYEDADKQLAKYESESKNTSKPLKKGFSISKIDDIPIYGSLYMNIVSPKNGVLAYGFHWYDNGVRRSIKTQGAYNYIKSNFPFEDSIGVDNVLDLFVKGKRR